MIKFYVVTTPDRKFEFRGDMKYATEYYDKWLFNALKINHNFEKEYGKMKNHEMIVDSGGLQFQRGESVDKHEVFDIQKKYADHAFILDQPLYGGDWKAGIKTTCQNIQEQIDYGMKDKLITILHGETEEKIKEWWDLVGAFDIKKMSVSTKPLLSSDVSSMKNYYRWLIWTLINDDRKWDMIHLMGISSNELFYLIPYINNKFKDRVKNFTFDSKLPFVRAYNMKYYYWGVGDFRMVPDESHFELKRLPHCNCFVCEHIREDYKSLEDFLRVKNRDVYNKIAVHNTLELKNRLDTLILMSESEKKYLKFLKKKLGPTEWKLVELTEEWFEGKMNDRELFVKLNRVVDGKKPEKLKAELVI